MEAEQREELRRLADQCICHPVSRGVREVEQAGEGIKELIDDLAETEKAYALLFAENARLRAELEAIAQPAKEAEPVAEVVMAQMPSRASQAWLPSKTVYASLKWLDSVPVGTKLYTTPQQSQPLTEGDRLYGFQAEDPDIAPLHMFEAGVQYAERAHNIKGVTE